MTGMVARARVRQEFTNPAAEWAEGVYVFPLPDDAAVDHLRMRVGDRIIEGMIRERAGGQGRLHPGPAAGPAREPGRAGAAQRVHDLGREHPARRGDHDRDRVPADRPVRRRRVSPALSRWWSAPLPPGEPVAGAGGAGLAPDTDQVPDASRITPPVRPPDRGSDESDPTARRARSRRAAGRGGVLVSPDPHGAAGGDRLRDHAGRAGRWPPTAISSWSGARRGCGAHRRAAGRADRASSCTPS